MKTATRIALLQGLIGIVSGVAWAMLSTPKAGLAALIGGGIGAVLTIYAAAKTFAVPASDARHAVMTFFRAEVRKLLLAAVLFAVAVRFFADVFAPLVSTFALSLLVYWFALLWDTTDG
ncbi:MAG: ATP synthase subunit I [Sinimarinibacterium flocculans]|uniref:F0F1-type ATP synthase assembly protein I n=1 Tax=Sinimarinibacterium flocculans TaxID=985250 RepID=A0A318EAC3_9GAMM|nr:ATP synthase subunit I [Sinimarinibacterium flocculans]MEC9364548.1 ATP synthase subunit I [Pseudomonadota bacterium]PXV66464.1 F0F1-type ATP synthase assembly protein I [Sinimarinibacterium flocculans]